MTKRTERVALPSPAPGTRRELVVHRYGKPGSRPKAYLQAALHADELPGLLALNHLIRMLDEGRDDVTGEIVVVPVANPVGLAQRVNGYLAGRYELAGGGNFNRNFPDISELIADTVRRNLANDSKLNVETIRKAANQAVTGLPRNTELAALRAALLSFSVDADIVLDVHCDLEALVHVYTSHHHRDMGAAFGAEVGAQVVLLEEEPGGSPFDDANAGFWWRLRERLGGDERVPLACFAATLELRGQADVSDSLAENDAANLYRFLQRQGVIAGNPTPAPAPLCEPTSLDATDVIHAPQAGIVAYRKELGARVEAGEVVGEIVDLLASDPLSARTPVASRASGVLFSRLVEKLVAPGDSIGKVAGSESLPHRQRGKLLEP